MISMKTISPVVQFKRKAYNRLQISKNDVNYIFIVLEPM